MTHQALCIYLTKFCYAEFVLHQQSLMINLREKEMLKQGRLCKKLSASKKFISHNLIETR